MKNVDNARCPTGRVNRIIQSLELADAEPVVTLKTESIMEDEIRYLVSPLREQYLETLSQEKRDKYESGTDVPETIQDMKQYIDGELRQKYVDTGLLTEEKYQNIATPLLSGLD
jgi:hypothetical protein